MKPYEMLQQRPGARHRWVRRKMVWDRYGITHDPVFMRRSRPRK